MGQKIAAYNANGAIIGFYDDKDSPAPNPLPTGIKLLNITDAQWQTCLSNQGWTIANGTLVAPVPPTAAQALQNAKDAQIALINNGCNATLQVIVAPYPPMEMATWPSQLSEAQAYTANNAAPTPTLSVIALAAGQTVAAQAASVLAKAAAYQAAAGAAIGKRQALTAQINAASSVAAVQAIIW